MKSTTRIYRVDGPQKERRLIRAVNPAQAVRFVTRPRFTCTVATQDDIADLVSAGIKVETASDDEGDDSNGHDNPNRPSSLAGYVP